VRDNASVRYRSWHFGVQLTLDGDARLELMPFGIAGAQKVLDPR
jgi:hypothetical protein